MIRKIMGITMVGLFILSSCAPKPKKPVVEMASPELIQQIEKIKAELEATREKKANCEQEIARLKAKKNSLAAEIERLKTERDSLRAWLDLLEKGY